MNLDALTDKELHTLVKLVDDRIDFCREFKDNITTVRLLQNNKSKEIAELELLKVKLNSKLGVY